MDYNEWKEEMNRTFSESQNDSTEGQAAEVKEAAGQITEEAAEPVQETSETFQTSSAEPVTYSWVNPKLQSGRNTENHESEYSNYQWRASDSQRRSYDSGSHTSSQTGSYSEGSNTSQQGTYSGGSSTSQQGTYSAGNNTEQKGTYSYSTGESAGRRTGSAGNVNGGAGTSDRRVRKARKGKPVSAGRSWARTIAMALVFGLVAGSVMFGVNRAGNAIFGSNAPKVETSSSKSYTKVATTKTTDKTDNLSDALDASTKTEGDAAYPGTVAEVAANAMPSLVTISTMSVQEMQSFFGGTQQYEVEGAGTGVIVGQNDTELLIATNNHVVEGATEVTVGFVDEKAVEAFIKGTDPSNDLAVVGVKLKDIPQETLDAIKVVAIGNSDDLVLGEQVVAIGNALGYGQSVTSGYISAFGRELQLSDESGSTVVSSDLIQTDAAINAGNSGGALLNMRGELVGINEAKSSSSGMGEASIDNVAYSIPISKAEPILQELMTLETKDKVAEEEKGYLGIRCADVNQETSERYNIPVGVYVREIGENSPAAEAGLMEGDVITKIDGRIVNQYADLEAALDYCKAGETIEVIVQRQANGAYEEQTLSVKLGKQAVLDNLSSDQEMEQNMQSGQNGD